VTGGRASTSGDNQREKPKDESKTRHHYWTKSQFCGSDSRSIDIFSNSSLLDGKRDDQNAVFGGQSDQRDKANLGVYVEA
jgi:hypothetical protein